ncbi:Shikimate kinase, chloroplastic [Orobanche gracilis]
MTRVGVNSKTTPECWNCTAPMLRLKIQNVVLVNVFSDALIEEAVGGSTVAEIFQSYGENFFRDNETMKRLYLYAIFEERGVSYANADVNIAAKLGSNDVCNLTPTVIAIEALLQMEIS